MGRRDYYKKIFFEIILMINESQALNGKVQCLDHKREIKRRLIAKFWKDFITIVEKYLFPKGKGVKVSKKERKKMFQGYLSIALHREMLDFCKENTKEPIVDSERVEALLGHAERSEINHHNLNPEEACSYEELVNLINEKIRTMSEKKRNALLIEILNKSKAEFTDKELQAHNSNLYRARNELAAYLRKFGFYMTCFFLLFVVGFCVGHLQDRDVETNLPAVMETVETEIDTTMEIAGHLKDAPTDSIILAGHLKDDPTDGIILAGHLKDGPTDSIVIA